MSAGAYALACLSFYRATPLGQVALLDAREQQVLARQISTERLPSEPYYRAPLWAGVLSIFYRLGMNDDGVLLAGQLTNIALHLLATLAIYFTALKLWNKRLGALLAAGLYGFYPVAIYFTGDLLDTTLAQALTCAGLYFFIRAVSEGENNTHPLPIPEGGVGDSGASPPRPPEKLSGPGFYGFLSGTIFGLGVLARPQLLAAALGAACLLLVGLFPRKDLVRPAIGLWLGLALVLVGFGTSEYARTGSFHVLPTQGSYNLWSANRPGTNGEYYSQRIEMVGLAEGENPARGEASALYLQATGNKSATEAKINQYWDERFFSDLKAHPEEFLRLYAQKLWRFLNNHESYNNKTYDFQKNRNPMLKWNPLGFVFLSLLALFTRLFYRKRPTLASFVTFIAAFYWQGAALFYTSDRFRLPMVPFILILAAGAPSAFLQLRARLKKGELKKIILLPKLGFLAAWGVVFCLPPSQAQDTTRADRLLMAQAALKVGDDEQAKSISEKLIEEPFPIHSAILCLLQARYNLILKAGLEPSVEWSREELALARRFQAPPDEVIWLRGLCEWKMGASRSAWRYLAAKNSSPETEKALGALMMTGSLDKLEAMELAKNADSIPVLLSSAALGSADARKKLNRIMGESQAQTTLRAWQNLFDHPGDKALNGDHAH